MKHLSPVRALVIIVIILVAAFLDSCGTTPDYPPPPPAVRLSDEVKVVEADYSSLTPVPTSIHLEGDAGSMEIRFRAENGDWPEAGDAMTFSDGYWNWTSETAVKGLEYYFVDGNGDRIDLGGAMGEYPGDPDEAYRTSAPEVWITQGLQLPYDPKAGGKPADMLTVLSINLHTYQEEQAGAKLLTVARAAAVLDADVILLQECAQNKDSAIVAADHYGSEIREDNAARIINNELNNLSGGGYDYFWDWSHYGWDVWEEGSAIISRFPMRESESRYISKSDSPGYWMSRKAVTALLEIPDGRTLRVFSVHAGWWNDPDEPFQTQFLNLMSWAGQLNATGPADYRIFAGDFNNEAGGPGWNFIRDRGNLIDSYFQANPGGLYDPSIGGNIDGWTRGLPIGRRVDYIFSSGDAALLPLMSQRVFTENVFGRVSDHNGVYSIFRLPSR